MTSEQFADLERIMGDSVELVQYADTVKNVSDLDEYIDGVEAVAAVLPSNMMADLWRRLNGKLLMEAVSERVRTDKIIELDDGRTEPEFEFAHKAWKRIVKFDIVTEIL